MIKGADISVYQGDVDFAKLKKVTDFVIPKATEGYGFTDPKFKRNQLEARKAGFGIGYYTFTRPDLGNTVEQEVDYLLSVLGTLQDGEIIFLDFEVPYAKPVEWCKKWLDYLGSKLNGYKGLVYLNQSLLNGNDWSPLIKANYGLWLAVYDYKYDAPIPDTKWGTLAFRQFSNKETLSGIAGVADCNVFYGDLPTFKKYGVKIGNSSPVTTTDPLQVKFDALVAKVDKSVSDINSKIDDILYRVKGLEDGYNKLKAYKDEQAKVVSDLTKINNDLRDQNIEMNKKIENAVKDFETKIIQLDTLTATTSISAKVKSLLDKILGR